MTLFDTIKIIHIVSSALIFGVSIGVVIPLLLANASQDVSAIIRASHQSLVLNACIVMPAGIVQLITGFVLTYLQGYHLSEAWGVYSLLGYGAAGFCWLAMIFLQARARDEVMAMNREAFSLPQRYYYYFLSWCGCGFFAFVSVVWVFYWMVYRSLLVIVPY